MMILPYRKIMIELHIYIIFMKVALFILLAIYLIAPVFLFRLNSKRVARFCLYMTTSELFRRFFCYMLLIAVLNFHFVFYKSFNSEYGIMISTLILIAMFSTRLTDKSLTMLADNHRLMFVFTILTVVIAFIPHLLPLACTMAILLAGACFYPSSGIRQCDRCFIIACYNECARKRDFRDFEDKYFS